MVCLVLDIETTSRYPSISPETGMLRDDCEILEVGYIRVDSMNKQILSHGTLYFYKPYFRVESEAQQVHGLTRSFLEQYEDDFEKNLCALYALFQNTCIIGKNSGNFDIPFIREFLIKHSNGLLDMHATIARLNIRKYDKSFLDYDGSSWSQDIQDLFKKTFQELTFEKRNEFTKRKGKLGEYVELLDAYPEVNRIYEGLTKDRVTGAHGALYDAVMTYVVWCYCFDNNLL